MGYNVIVFQADGTGSRSLTIEALEFLETEAGRPADLSDEQFVKWNAASIYAGTYIFSLRWAPDVHFATGGTDTV